MPSRALTAVTVTFPTEFPLLLIQARSIVRYMTPDFVQRIIWIVNGTSGTFRRNLAFFEKAEATLRGAGFDLQVLYADRLDLSPSFHRQEGWRRQQLLKLLIARQITTPHYLLLDTKNFLTRTVDEDTLFREGKPISWVWDCTPNVVPWLKASAKALDVEADGINCMPTATPYVMDSKVVLDLLDSLKPSLPELFEKEPEVTEFFLYYCFLRKKVLIEQTYHFVPEFYASFYTRHPATPEAVREVKKRAETDLVFCVSFHRSRFTNCPPGFADYIRQVWHTHGLIRDGSEFRDIFAAMKERRSARTKIRGLLGRIKRRVGAELARLFGWSGGSAPGV